MSLFYRKCNDDLCQYRTNILELYRHMMPTVRLALRVVCVGRLYTLGCSVICQLMYAV